MKIFILGIEMFVWGLAMLFAELLDQVFAGNYLGNRSISETGAIGIAIALIGLAFMCEGFLPHPQKRNQVQP